MQFRLSFFERKSDNRPRHLILTWEAFTEKLATPAVREEKDGPLFSPATFAGGVRAKENVKELSALVVDCDSGFSFDRAAEALRKFNHRAAIYTTHSHGRVFEGNLNGVDKWRAVVPFERPVNPADYEALWGFFNGLFDNALDAGARDTARMSYLPAHAPGAPYKFMVLVGEPFPGSLEDLKAIPTPSNGHEQIPDSVVVSWNNDAVAAMVDEIRLVETAPVGERNTRLSRAAYALGGYIPSGKLQEFKVRAELERAGLATGLPGVEVARTIEASLRAGMAKRRDAETGEAEPVPFIPSLQSALGKGEIVRYPLEAFPTWVSQYAGEASHEMQVAPEAAGTIALATIAAVTGPHATISIRGGWEENLNLYTLVALPPASRKSQIFKALTRPLREIEMRIRKDERPAFLQLQAVRTRRLATLKGLERAMGAPGADRDKLGKQMEDLKLLIDQAGEPIETQLIVDDITPETLATVLSRQGGAIALFSAEGGMFDQISGRYNNGMANFDVYLKGHSGDEIKVNRRERYEDIPNPRVTVALTVQPDVLVAAARNPSFLNRGLLGRILYAMPEARLGFREIAPVAASVASKGAYFEGIGQLKAGIKPGARLALSRHADEALQTWEAEIEKALAPNGKLCEIQTWAGKLAGQTVRIAANLHLAWNSGSLTPWPEVVSEETVIAAISLARYYVIQAAVIFEVIKESPHAAAARKIINWARAGGYFRFTARDVRQTFRHVFNSTEAVTETLIFMAGEGWATPSSAPVRHAKDAFKGAVWHIAPNLMRGQD